jgi:excisionase family DNA binding protein
MEIWMRPKDLTTKEAAERLGVTPRRVLVLIESGRLRARRFGHAWAIAEKDLAAVADRRNGRPPKIDRNQPQKGRAAA